MKRKLFVIVVSLLVFLFQSCSEKKKEKIEEKNKASMEIDSTYFKKQEKKNRLALKGSKIIQKLNLKTF